MGQAKLLRRSLAALSAELSLLGHAAGPTTVSRLLDEEGYVLRLNVKRLTGPAHPDRDRQFRYPRGQIDRFRDAGLPVIGIDAKKKELIGDFKNGGAKRWPWEAGSRSTCRRLPPAGRPVPGRALRHLRPAGQPGARVYRPVVGHGGLRGGVGPRGWCRCRLGCKRYGAMTELLILADSGGSNGCRPRSWWKKGLQGLADCYGLCLTVCHYPPGASKWNPIEHRLFGPISVNWSGAAAA